MLCQILYNYISIYKILVKLLFLFLMRNTCPRGGGGGGGGEGTLIFSYIRRLGSFFFIQNFGFIIFWDFQKNYYFSG